MTFINLIDTKSSRSIYYMEESVLLGTKPLEQIPYATSSGTRVAYFVQLRHDSRLLLLLNWFLASRLLSRIKSMASRFASISDEEGKELTEKLENENTTKRTLYDIKVFKEYLDACDEKREIEDITPVEQKKLKITVSDDSSQSQ